MYPCLFLAVKTHAAGPPHTPTPSTGRDNTGASRGFDAAVPGPPSVPGFLCLNRRKEALSSMRPQDSGDQGGACLCVHVCSVQCCGSVQRFCSMRSLTFTQRVFPFLLCCTWTLQRGRDEEKTALTSSSISCHCWTQPWWWDDKQQKMGGSLYVCRVPKD